MLIALGYRRIWGIYFPAQRPHNPNTIKEGISPCTEGKIKRVYDTLALAEAIDSESWPMSDARLQEPGLVFRADRLGVERNELHWAFRAFSQPHLRLDTVPPFLRSQEMTVLLPDLSYTQ